MITAWERFCARRARAGARAVQRHVAAGDRRREHRAGGALRILDAHGAGRTGDESMTSPPGFRPAGDRLVCPADAGRLGAAAIGPFAANLAPEAERA